ncbi:NADPH:quinone reductase-like Zn-dependent oxidoreductase [Bradyrhizobium sp. LB7.2]
MPEATDAAATPTPLFTRNSLRRRVRNRSASCPSVRLAFEFDPALQAGDYAAANVRSLTRGGRLVIIGFMGGRIANEIDLTQIVSRRLTITGSTMRPRTADDKATIAHELLDRVWPQLDAGQCTPEIHRVFPMAEAAEAHRLMESSDHIGKIVLRV